VRVRNENSSRFGKFIQILFAGDHTICGGRVRHYLLEKARVVSQHEGERNYHVFYHMCAGIEGELQTALHLASPQKFHYLNQSGVYELLDTDGKPLCDEKLEFARTQQSMTQMRIDPETQDQVWEVLAAVLHLGNINFETVANKNAADGSKVSAESIGTLGIVSKLLKCDEEVLNKGMTCSLVKVTGEAQPIEVPQSTESCTHARDALSKVVYEKLFAWLVGCINECLQHSDALEGLTEAEKKKIEKHFIGVLDIFGFEVFENNSFEQLCINYANESLQQQFINQMLHAMMAQYEKEGVAVNAIPFEDNSPCLELLESKMGIFSMLDDECNFPKGTDETFLGKIMDSHKGHTHLKPGGSSSDPHLKDNLGSMQKTTMGGVRGRMLTIGEAFVVSHFAGEVEYNVRNFLEKNRDTINESLKTILNSSEQALVKKLLKARAAAAEESAPAEGAKTGGRIIGGRVVGGSTGARGVRGGAGAGSIAQRKEDKRSLGSQFKMQLNELVGLIESGKAHYVRCIKPNGERRPHTFDAPSVIRQLRCSGVTETVRQPLQGGVHEPFQGKDSADGYDAYLEVLFVFAGRVARGHEQGLSQGPVVVAAGGEVQDIPLHVQAAHSSARSYRAPVEPLPQVGGRLTLNPEKLSYVVRGQPSQAGHGSHACYPARSSRPCGQPPFPHAMPCRPHARGGAAAKQAPPTACGGCGGGVPGQGCCQARQRRGILPPSAAKGD